MTTSEKWSGMDFWNEAKTRLESDEYAALREVYDLFKNRGQKPIWGPSSNADGGFQFGFGRSDSILHRYASGDLHFYRRRFNLDLEFHKRCKERLEGLLCEVFTKDCKLDHVQLSVEIWKPKLKLMLDTFRELLPAAAT